MRHLDLFSGIGGFALAAQNVWGTEYENVGFCDNEPFSQAIIKKHWPSATIYDDIKKLLAPPPADLVTGGFPCQPFSSAGKRRGKEDDRHLWPEMLRVIRASAPRWVIGENVGGLLTWNGGMVLDEVCADLEREGYEVWPFVIPAVAINAPHRRDRVWIVANRIGDRGGEGRPKCSESRIPEALFKSSTTTDTEGQQTHPTESSRLHSKLGGSATNASNPCGSGFQRSKQQGARGERIGIGQAGTHGSVTKRNNDAPDHAEFGTWGNQKRSGQRRQCSRNGSNQGPNWSEDWPTVAARLCSVDDGLPGGLARPRGWRNAALKGAGNAIVPQVAIEIMRAIKSVDYN